MKQSIANVWILGLVITFILIFSAFIIITINYNKVFKMKNTVITIIEKHNGMTSKRATCGQSSAVGGSGSICVGAGALQTINVYLNGMAYNNKGACPANEGWKGVTNISDVDSGSYEDVGSNTSRDYYYCFKKSPSYNGKASYYEVKLFFFMELPIIGNFIPINVDGTTDDIYNAKDGI